MSAGVLAGAAALAFYAYVRQRTCGVAGAADPQWPIETHTNLEHAPNTWAEALYLAKEALRYVYQSHNDPSGCIQSYPCLG
jgi:hypothetical protein